MNVYAQLAILAATSTTGFFVGAGLTERDYESRLRTQADEAAESWNAALEAANREAEAQRKRDVAAAEARGRRSVAAKAVTHEILAAGTTCDWTPDERMRLERLYGAHGFNPDGAPAGVQDRLPVAAESGHAQK